jgi:hypothetical protein
MAILLYTYSVTSIRAAKVNAQRHREADGGQLNMRNEMYRQRGWIDRPSSDRPSSDRELILAGLKGDKGDGKGKGKGEGAKGGAGKETVAEKEKREGEEKLAEARGRLRRGEGSE